MKATCISQQMRVFLSPGIKPMLRARINDQIAFTTENLWKIPTVAIVHYQMILILASMIEISSWSSLDDRDELTSIMAEVEVVVVVAPCERWLLFVERQAAVLVRSHRHSQSINFVMVAQTLEL